MRKNKIKFLFIILISFQFIVGCNYSSKHKNEILNEPEKPLILEDFGTINPNAPSETIQFGKLVGKWDCISRDLDDTDKENPKWISNKAKWKWEYVLGGHALLNNWWQEDNSPNATIKEYFATGIFIFNSKTKLWEIVVLNSKPHKISPKFQAELKEDEIQMHDGTGKWLVTFYNIKKNSFQWKYEILAETGQWKSISEINAVRKISYK